MINRKLLPLADQQNARLCGSVQVMVHRILNAQVSVRRTPLETQQALKVVLELENK
jgi:hypothetical protein